MPWTVANVDEHKKGLTDAEKKRWVKVANSALKRCQDEGGEDCEASAIKQANSVAGEQKERAVEYKGYITSTNSALISVNAIDVGGEAVPVAELVAAYEEKTKTVGGKSRPAGDFLVVEDPDKPDTWHLPVKKNGKPDHGLMGAAKAALTSPGGHRGNPYEGPDKAKATSKLKALYKSEDMAWNEEAAEMDVDKLRGLLGEALDMLGEQQEEIAEAELCENVAFDAFMPEGDHSAAIMEVVKEAGITVDEGRRAPVVVDLQIISPGPGNKKDKRYYPSETLNKYAHVFENSDIFVTEHKANERGEKTKVGRIRKCPARFTEKGAIIGRTIIYDPSTAEKIRNRADSGELKTLHCSIFGTGDVQPGKVGDKKYGIVKSINPNPLVEFVGRDGAGGHAVALSENIEGGVNMDKDQIEKLLSESDLPQEAQERLAGVEYENEETVKEAILKEQAQEPGAPQKLAEGEVERLVEATKLPDAFKAALRAVEYDDEKAVEAAIAEAVEEVKKATGSGRPFAQGDTQPVQDKPLSERDLTVRFNEIMDRVGGRQVPVPAEQ